LGEHPDREELECFARGEILAERGRWIENHLRTGCGICQRSVDDLLPRLEGPATSVLAHPPLALPTLAASATSTPLRPLHHRGAPETHPSRDHPPQDAGQAGETREAPDLWDETFAKVERWIPMIAAERDAAPQLLVELLAHPVREQVSLVRGSRRFQTLSLCSLLIEASFETTFHDPAEAIATAEIGVLAADQLDSCIYGSALVHDMRARAWAFLGNARRAAADLAGAERAIAFAESLAEDGSADPLEEAQLLDLKANLLCDLGRFQDATRLIETVIDIYQELDDQHGKGRALIAKGVFLGYSGWPQQAVQLISEGLALVDDDLDPRVVPMARHHLACFLHGSGRCGGDLDPLDAALRQTVFDITSPPN
jgi:tetratricopeptide (TPR) repeat protein